AQGTVAGAGLGEGSLAPEGEGHSSGDRWRQGSRIGRPAQQDSARHIAGPTTASGGHFIRPKQRSQKGSGASGGSSHSGGNWNCDFQAVIQEEPLMESNPRPPYSELTPSAWRPLASNHPTVYDRNEFSEFVLEPEGGNTFPHFRILRRRAFFLVAIAAGAG